MKKKEIVKSIKIIILSLILSLDVGYAFAITSTYAPLNVGSSPQSKAGGLDITAGSLRVTSSTGGFLSAGTAQFKGDTLFSTANSPISSTNPISAAYIRSLNGYSNPITPDYTFWGNTNTGMYHPTPGNILAFSTAGTERAKIDATGIFSIKNLTHAPASGTKSAICATATGQLKVCDHFTLTVQKTGTAIGLVQGQVFFVSSPTLRQGTVFVYSNSAISCGDDIDAVYTSCTGDTLDVGPFQQVDLMPVWPIENYSTTAVTWTGCDSIDVNNHCIVTLNHSRIVAANFKATCIPGTQTFPPGNSWIVPRGCSNITLEARGGGGGGAGGYNESELGYQYGGGGGGRGGYGNISSTISALGLTPGATVTVTVGAGGTVGAGASSSGGAGSPGGPGGATSFGSSFIVSGGNGGSTGYGGNSGSTTYQPDCYAAYWANGGPQSSGTGGDGGGAKVGQTCTGEIIHGGAAGVTGSKEGKAGDTGYNGYGGGGGGGGKGSAHSGGDGGHGGDGWLKITW